MHDERGVVYIAFGDKSIEQAELSKAALVRHNPWLTPGSIKIIGGPTDNPARTSRLIKTQLPSFSSFQKTCYLDADTRPQTDISVGFESLSAGYDIAMTPSLHQDDEAFWHVTDAERMQTTTELGYTPLQLQAGVMFFGRSDRTIAFFEEWNRQWLRYGGQDQAAFIRAAALVNPRIWLLGYPWNGGAVIHHYFGRCRCAYT